jgi:hypothetical protein
VEVIIFLPLLRKNLIFKIMKGKMRSFLFGLLLIAGNFFLNFSVLGQEVSGSPSLPENINKIVTFSCMPCHTSKGGLMSRTKLNFTEWTNYSITKQKEKAQKMYSELKKSAMPPKTARETRPEIIPTPEQVAIIKKWAQSLPSGSN